MQRNIFSLVALLAACTAGVAVADLGIFDVDTPSGGDQQQLDPAESGDAAPLPSEPAGGPPLPPVGRPATKSPAAKSPPGGAGPNLLSAGDMIGFSRELSDGTQAITIINASKRWMAVYHISSGGQIRLVSSRPLDADFTIQFNAASPLPEEIRRLQGR